MFSSKVTSVNVGNYSDEQVFIYEVLLPSASGSRVRMKVSLDRMSETNRQISLLGGKIINILPLKSENYEPQTELAWWVEIATYQPRCIYFFGPFDTENEAQAAQSAYIEDLHSEGASGISVKIKYCQPISLTIEY